MQKYFNIYKGFSFTIFTTLLALKMLPFVPHSLADLEIDPKLNG